MSMSSTLESTLMAHTPVEKGTSDTLCEEFRCMDDDAPRALNAEEERRLWRKVDLRVMPILGPMYLFTFMDRGNIGSAKLTGLLNQLDLSGNRYNIALTMFFISYCTFECPANLVLKVFRPSRWLPGIMVLWGIIMTSMAFAQTYPELIGARFCLGVAEAGLFPGVVYYLTLWYPRHMLQYRIGLFFGAATIAGAFSGLLAFGIEQMEGMGRLECWSWIFIVEGLTTMTVGVVAFFVIVDFPSTATFLTPEERAFLIWRKKYDNSSVGEEECFALRHVIAAFVDWQVYLHILVYMSIVVPLYGITFYLPTIIKSFGYTISISELLTVPPYVLATIVLSTWAHYSDKLGIRSVFIYSGLLLLLIGYSVLISNAAFSIKYFGILLVVTGSYAAFPGVVAWLGNNLAGQYKRAVGMAIHIGFGNFGGAIASNIYRSQDSPRYIPGHTVELIFVSVGLVIVPILAIWYKRINDERDEALRRRITRMEGFRMTTQQLRDMGDRAPDFRYTL